jgi:hypothetical protein
LPSRYEVRERVAARWDDQRRELAVIGDLDRLPGGDLTQNLATLVSHLAVRDGSHVAQRSTHLPPLVEALLVAAAEAFVLAGGVHA